MVHVCEVSRLLNLKKLVLVSSNTAYHAISKYIDSFRASLSL